MILRNVIFLPISFLLIWGTLAFSDGSKRFEISECDWMEFESQITITDYVKLIREQDGSDHPPFAFVWCKPPNTILISIQYRQITFDRPKGKRAIDSLEEHVPKLIKAVAERRKFSWVKIKTERVVIHEE